MEKQSAVAEEEEEEEEEEEMASMENKAVQEIKEEVKNQGGVTAGAVLHPADGAQSLKLEEKEKVYPAPLHSHKEVVGDRGLFMESLRHFHSSMSTKFMVPVIGGKDLDLHLLYVEVTQRGGLEKVIEEKKWRDVIAAFKFPPTTTSASFVLKRYYLSLLHHYEQVYFFRSQGPLIPPSASSQTKSPFNKLDHSLIISDSTRQKANSRKRPFAEPHNKEPYNFTVSGSIDGKFEYGYMVTVKIGNDTLRGVLYHVHHLTGAPNLSSEGTTAAAAPAPPLIAAPETFSIGGRCSSYNSVPPQIRRRRRRARRERDPMRPKTNRSAYNFFFAEKHAMLKSMHPEKEREFSKMIGESWNKLTDNERMVYQERGREDKERYKKEMQEYHEKLKLEQPKEGVSCNMGEVKPE